jgi:hypothetical protein
MDKIEYLAYLFFGLGGISLALLSIVLGLLLNLGIKTSLWISLGILLVILYIVPIWRKSRKIKERFVDPYRDWVGGEEYTQKAPVLYDQMISESMKRGQDKGNLAFIWTSRLLFGLYFVFYIAGILFSIFYPLPAGLSSIVIFGGGVVLIIGLIVLRKDIHGYYQALRQDPKLIIPFSLLVVFIGSILGLLWLH